MDLLTAIKSRRSIRDFDKNRIVERDIIEEIIGAGTYAPTSCNLQVFQFILVDDETILQDIERNVTGKANWTRQLLVLVVDPEITFGNHANYISAGMVVQNLLLRAQDLGVGTCPIAGFDNKGHLKKLLGVPRRLDIPLLIFVGYAAGSGAGMPFREPLSQLYSVNQYQLPAAFPTSIDIDAWTQEQVEAYRRRIFSVYFPRLRHGVWRKGLERLWEDIGVEIEQSQGPVLACFVWERNALERLAEVARPVHVVDVIPEYLKFLREHFGEHFAGYHLVQELPPEDINFDRIVLVNTLMFQADRDALFSALKRSLGPEGRILLWNFNPFGAYALLHRTLSKIGAKAHVYHKSSFYKIGPYKFVGRREIERLCHSHGLEISASDGYRSEILTARVPRAVRPLFHAISKVMPESMCYQLRHSSSAYRRK